MREARRLALLRRQSLIAAAARRQALAGLAEALEAEARSNALAERSRSLAAAGAPRPGTTSGAMLAARSGFAAGLHGLAGSAAEAAAEAARRSVWQAETLAVVENRARRLAEREAEAAAALSALKTRRDEAHAQHLARKLQNKARG